MKRALQKLYQHRIVGTRPNTNMYISQTLSDHNLLVLLTALKMFPSLTYTRNSELMRV